MKRIAEKIREFVLVHTKVMVVILMLILFLFVVMFIWISTAIDLQKWMQPKECLSYLYVAWDVQDVLSLMFGYLGTGATVVLGFIAWRFSLEAEERKWVEQLQQVKIEGIYFYDMHECFQPSKLRHNDTRDSQFLIEAEISGGSSHYQMCVEKVWWGSCDENYEKNEERELTQEKIYVENASHIKISVYFNEFELMRDDLRSSISYFYHLCNYEPLLMDRHLRCRWLHLDVRFCEKVWLSRQKPREFLTRFEILVENPIKDSQADSYIILRELQHNFEIMG